MGCDIVKSGIVDDSFEKTRNTLEQMAAKVDCVITTGGVSVGEEDHVKAAVEENGYLDLWKLAIKPGKPFASGKIRGKQFFGLPGNPVSALVTLHQVGLPVIRTLSGETLPPRIRIPAIVVDTLRKRPGRADYQRGIAELHEDGQWQVRSTGQQGSGILSSVSRANCFIVLEQDRGRVNAGETVLVEMFDQWLL